MSKPHPPVSLAQYHDMLNRHDWYHSMSDDPRKMDRGEREAKILTAISNQSPEHKAMLEGFFNHHWSGPAWNTPKAPKPERPNE